MDRAEALELWAAGCSAAEIARRLDYNTTHVRKVLRELGASLLPRRRMADERHGERLYALWKSVLARCQDPRDRGWARFGARGITVCDEWRSFWPFYDWAIAAGYEPLRTLAIRGRARRFSPLTCEWITARQRMERDGFPGGEPGQGIRAFGESKSAREWAADPRCKVSVDALLGRIRRGVAPREAISAPPRAKLAGDPRRARAKQVRKRLDWPAIVRLHVDEGLVPRAIADRVGANADGIRRGLRQRGVYSPRKKLGPHGRRLRKIHEGMIHRCTDPAFPTYRWYGARGARVCDEWKSFRAFHAWAIAAGYQPGLCLVRKPGARDYSPAECEWSTFAEAWSKADRRRSEPGPRWTVEAFGETKGPTAWSRDKRCQVSISTLVKRLRDGWAPESAISSPPRVEGGRAPRRYLTAFGETKGMTEWTRDRRCKVRIEGLRARLKRGIPPEQAIATPRFEMPVHAGRKKRKKSSWPRR